MFRQFFITTAPGLAKARLPQTQAGSRHIFNFVLKLPSTMTSNIRISLLTQDR